MPDTHVVISLTEHLFACCQTGNACDISPNRGRFLHRRVKKRPVCVRSVACGRAGTARAHSHCVPLWRRRRTAPPAERAACKGRSRRGTTVSRRRPPRLSTGASFTTVWQGRCRDSPAAATESAPETVLSPESGRRALQRVWLSCWGPRTLFWSSFIERVCRSLLVFKYRN